MNILVLKKRKKNLGFRIWRNWMVTTKEAFEAAVGLSYVSLSNFVSRSKYTNNCIVSQDQLMRVLGVVGFGNRLRSVMWGGGGRAALAAANDDDD